MNRIFLATVLAAITLTNSVTATQFISPKGEDTIMANDYDDDIFIAANKIRFDGKVRGDMYVACNEVVTSDTINGNLTTFCRSIQCLGPVGRSFLGGAQDIFLNAPVERNILAFAQKITIGPETVIGTDATLYGETVIFQGHTKRDLVINSDNATIAGTVEGDLRFEGGILNVSPDAVIQGDFIYCSPKKAEIADLTVIEGEVKWTECVIEQESKLSPLKVFTWLVSHRGYFLALTLFSLVFFILSVIPFPPALAMSAAWIGLLISGNLFLMVTKNLSRQTESIIRKNTLPTIGLGFTVLFLSPIAILILILSMLGAPLGAVMMLAFGLACFAGGIYGALFIGKTICRFLNMGSEKSTGYGCFSLGLVILVALSFLPYIGYFIFVIVLMMGIGGLSLALFGKNSETLPSNQTT